MRRLVTTTLFIGALSLPAGVLASQLDEVEVEAKRVSDQAIAEAKSRPFPPVDIALEGTFVCAGGAAGGSTMREMTISAAMNEALREEMTHDQGIFVIGEDIGHFGGTFDVTLNLQAEFGPRRIVSTPVSENAIVGVAVGAALAGMRPVAEIMFCDFMACGMDQIINYAAMSTYACGGNDSICRIVGNERGRVQLPRWSPPSTLKYRPDNWVRGSARYNGSFRRREIDTG